MDITLILHGVVLPLMATLFIPVEARKNGFFSRLVLCYLLIVFSASLFVHQEKSALYRTSLSLLNVVLIYFGARLLVYFDKPNSKRKK